MSDDIVRRLKEQHHNTTVLDGDLMREAADEIEKLRAENEKLRTALKPFANEARLYHIDEELMAEWCEAAAAALKETPDESKT